MPQAAADPFGMPPAAPPAAPVVDMFGAPAQQAMPPPAPMGMPMGMPQQQQQQPPADMFGAPAAGGAPAMGAGGAGAPEVKAFEKGASCCDRLAPRGALSTVTMT